MDELKLSFGTNYMKNLIAQIISKFLVSKLGYDVKVLLNDISIKNENGKFKIHANVDAEIRNTDAEKLLKNFIGA